jgi:hypothetical protein
MGKLLKIAIAIVTVAAAARAVRDVYVGRRLSAPRENPCCGGCAAGKGCG